jgi:predicted DNA-binding transcriptional regulator YafY
MDKFDRIYQLDAILRARRTPIGWDELMHRLECSRPTLFRALGTLRNTLRVPLEYDRTRRGYLYARDAAGGVTELPGLWFNAAELHALLVLQRVLETLEPGFLHEQFAPLSRRIDELMSHRRLGLAEAARRVRAIGMAGRPAGPHFISVAAATLQRRRLHIRYRDRSRDRLTERDLSPQRLVRYRDAWYVDAWCHLRQGLRQFAIDRIEAADVLDARADDIDEAQLDAHYASAYGIFSGAADKTAVLHFTAERARWVASERWHPEQRSRFLDDGRYELTLPYRDSRELVMDVLRHGEHVEVVAPESLQAEVMTALREALRQYGKAPKGRGRRNTNASE